MAWDSKAGAATVRCQVISASVGDRPPSVVRIEWQEGDSTSQVVATASGTVIPAVASDKGPLEASAREASALGLAAAGASRVPGEADSVEAVDSVEVAVGSVVGEVAAGSVEAVAEDSVGAAVAGKFKRGEII
jgi:hypothetical protein